MIWWVIALTPTGGGWLQSHHGSEEEAGLEARKLNALGLPWRYGVVERRYP